MSSVERQEEKRRRCSTVQQDEQRWGGTGGREARRNHQLDTVIPLQSQCQPAAPTRGVPPILATRASNMQSYASHHCSMDEQRPPCSSAAAAARPSPLGGTAGANWQGGPAKSKCGRGLSRCMPFRLNLQKTSASAPLSVELSEDDTPPSSSTTPAGTRTRLVGDLLIGG